MKKDQHIENSPDVIAIKERLIRNIREVSEIEHGLCLQYLYAAFSIKTHLTEEDVTSVQLELLRDWKKMILRVAREEMLHMALTCNLLTSIGSNPYFDRPNFPKKSDYYPIDVDFTLATFDQATLDRFIAFEQPDHMQLNNQKQTVAGLYEIIRNDLQSINEKLLFIGRQKDQIIEREITDPTEEFEDDVRTGYGVEPFAIETMADANRAIDLIVEQGEGADNVDAHYATFLRIKREFLEQENWAKEKQLKFIPGRQVVSDPRCSDTDNLKGNQITHPASRKSALLFSQSYQLMMIMMLRFYEKKDSLFKDRFALQQIIFFPLMTMVIRPLGELITQMPQKVGDTNRFAGPPFDFPKYTLPMSSTEEAFAIISERLSELGEIAEGLGILYGYKKEMEHLSKRAAFIEQNIKRLHQNFIEFKNEGNRN